MLGLASQGIKICVDTFVQTGVDDAFRGRVFSLYDVALQRRLRRGGGHRGRGPARRTAGRTSCSASCPPGYLLTAVAYAPDAASRWPEPVSRAVHHSRSAAAASSSLIGPPVDPQLEQVPVGLADLAPGTDAEQLHDLVAVEVGADRVELLLLGELVDPGLQLVVRPPQPLGLAPVAGRAVGPGEHVQPVELVAGVPDVAAHRRVGPLPAAVAVEPQVQLDEPSRRRRCRRWRTAAPSSACG